MQDLSQEGDALVLTDEVADPGLVRMPEGLLGAVGPELLGDVAVVHLDQLGGRVIHPVLGLPGGVSKGLTEENREEFRKTAADAVEFANRRLWGTLSATLIVHPQSLKDPQIAAAVDQAGDLYVVGRAFREAETAPEMQLILGC